MGFEQFYMINKRLEDITEEDIENLIMNGEREGKTIEYKRDIPDNTDSSKKKFLASISSFVGHLMLWWYLLEDSIVKNPSGLSITFK